MTTEPKSKRSNPVESMDLLACPFCGGEATVQEELRKSFVAYCVDQGCVEMPCERNAYFTSYENAVKAWNTRANS